MFADLRLACRQLFKSPGFTATVVLSLALGIGANAMVLAWLQELVLRPLPGVAEPGRLVSLVSNQGGGCTSLPDLATFVAEGGVFTDAVSSMPTVACLENGDGPRWINTRIVTANYFDALGVRALHGRTFRPDEDRLPGGNPVLVIGAGLWQRAFQGAPDIVGRVVTLNRHAFTVIGVVADEFRGTLPPGRIEAWAPASMIAEVRNQDRFFLTSRTARGWHNLARLRADTTIDQAETAVAAIDARLAGAFPGESRDIHHHVVPLSQSPWGAQKVIGPTLWLLLAVTAGVQLIVVANVANLLLARAVARRREVAVRLAVGAGRLRLLRQFGTESALLTGLGAALGLFVASWAVDAIYLFVPTEPGAEPAVQFHLGQAAVLGTLGASVLSALVFGLAPALQTLRPDLAAALKDGGRNATGDRRHRRLRHTLVVAEVAIAAVLLIGAGLCLAGLRHAQRIDIGLDPQGVLVSEMRIGMNGYTAATGPDFYLRLRERLAARPEVEEVALASWLPLGFGGCKGSYVTVEGYERPPGADLTYEFVIVSPRYFAALRIPLVAGRDFTDADDLAAPRVAIVNEHFAQRFWPGQDPLGRRFRSGGEWRTVVGVAKAGKYNRLDEAPRCFFYLPYTQGVPDLDLDACVRTKVAPAGFAGTMQTVVGEIDPAVTLRRSLPLAVHCARVFIPQRIATALLLVLGGMALALAVMGIYAVIAYGVSQRAREFGVRMALGASRGAILRLVLRQSLVLIGLGIAVGLVSSWALARHMAGLLCGLTPYDPVLFAGVAAGLVGVALVAAWWPARRATTVEPSAVLRGE